MRNTSQTYHTANETADVHSDKGKHRHYNGIVFENGALVESTTPDFPSQVDALNDWREPGEQLEDGFEAAGATLKKLIRWLVQYDSDRPRHLQSIGRRCVALAFVVLGGECGGSWTTMNAAAKELRCTRQSLSKYNAELSELARGRFQRANTFAGGSERAATSLRRLKQWDVRGRLPSAQKRRASAAANRAWRAANPDRVAASRARQAKLSRKNTLQTPKTP